MPAQLWFFTHVLERYVKQEADARLILACIVAMGTNMGLWKMAEVSGLSYSSLLTTARNFLRAETLHAANDGIANATAALSMFEQYDIDEHKHSSSEYEQKLAADDQEAIKILRGISPVAWRDVNLIGNFDFSAGTSRVDIEALAPRYNNPDFWRRSMQETDDDGPE